MVIRKSKKIFLISIVTIICLLAPTSFLISPPRLRENLFWKPLSAKLEISLDDNSLLHAPRPIYTQTTSITGRTTLPAKVQLWRSNSFLAEVLTDSEGKFRIDDVSLNPGDNNFKVTATANVLWREIQAEEFTHVRWEPQQPLTPTIYPLPEIVNTPKIVIRGTSYPNALVTITVTKREKGQVAGESKAEGEDEKTPYVDDNGHFHLEAELSEPGTYAVSAFSKNSQGVVSSSSPEITFTYNPYLYPSLKTSVERKATIYLSHKRLVQTLEITLPKDDPRIVALLKDQITLQQFFMSAFNLQLNSRTYLGEFVEVRPEISITEKGATVRASSNPQIIIREFMPTFNGTLELSEGSGFPLKNTGDTLTIVVSEYTVKAYNQPPSTLIENKATWIGGTDYSAPDESLKVQLTYSPFTSPQNLFRLIQLNPTHFWEYPGDVVPTLLVGILSVIPMLWLLWLLGKYQNRDIINEDAIHNVTWVSHTLIVLSLIYPTLDFARGVAYLLFFRMQYRVSGEVIIPPILLIPPLVFVIVLMWVGQKILSRANRAWAIWLRNIFRGFLRAAFICMLLSVSGSLEYYFLGISFHITASVMAVVTLYVLYRCIQKLSPQSEILKAYLKKTRIVIIGLIIIFAFPLYLFIGGSLYRLSSTLNRIQSYFYIIQDLSPYVLAIAILLLLKQLREKGGVEKALILNLGLLLFSAYLVGTTPNFLLLPLPFILSLWAFRYVIISKIEVCHALDEIKHDVVEGRRKLIDSVLANDTAQGFKDRLDQLKTKVVTGDLTPEAFEERKAQIEAYAAERERANKLPNGLEAEQTVLGIGPYSDNWENGRWAVKWAVILVLPFLIIYFVILITRGSINLSHPYLFLWNISLIIIFLSDWLIGAFFFGYFFNYIQGKSGLKKGLRTSTLIILCLLPTWLNSLSTSIEVSVLLLRAGQTFLFFMVLGLWAFDYKTFRNTLHDQFKWKTFSRFGNMASFTAVVSVLITSIGVALSSVITGQFKELVAQLVGVIFGQLPGGPPTS